MACGIFSGGATFSIKELVMSDHEFIQKRSPWPFPAGARHRIVPERRNVDAPSTDYEYANGDRSDKSGRTKSAKSAKS